MAHRLPRKSGMLASSCSVAESVEGAGTGLQSCNKNPAKIHQNGKKTLLNRREPVQNQL
jgi:hypothetical protein